MKCKICDAEIEETEGFCVYCEHVNIKKIKETEDFWDKLHYERGILEIRHGQLLEAY
jgi:hypothetical protein